MLEPGRQVRTFEKPVHRLIDATLKQTFIVGLQQSLPLIVQPSDDGEIHIGDRTRREDQQTSRTDVGVEISSRKI